MKIEPTGLPGVMLITPKVFGDERGFFFESWNERAFEAAGIRARFVLDNHSRSARGVLRGLHYQVGQPQGKLVRVIAGEIFDVVLDIRRSSPSFGRWASLRLDSLSKQMLWVPAGFAHGFLVTSNFAEVLYKTTDFYAPAEERTIAWDDSKLAIDWPIHGTPVLSPKDARGARFADAEMFP